MPAYIKADGEPGKGGILRLIRVRPYRCRRRFAAQSRVLRFERSDSLTQQRHRFGNFRLCEARCDVLGAVDVPRFDREQDRALWTRAIALVEQLCKQRWIVLDDARAAPHLDALALGEIQKKQI